MGGVRGGEHGEICLLPQDGDIRLAGSECLYFDISRLGSGVVVGKCVTGIWTTARKSGRRDVTTAVISVRPQSNVAQM